MLENNAFFIYNKEHTKSRIAMWGTKGREMGTFDDGVYADQLWMLVPERNEPGYFYIENVHRSRYRIAKWGSGDREVGAFGGHYYSDQLWKFEKQHDGHYLIYNKNHPESRIAKWGGGDSDWGTFDGPIYEDQKWKLVPQFECVLKEETIWEYDNSQGTSDKSKKEIMAKGVQVDNPEKCNERNGLRESLRLSLSAARLSAARKADNLQVSCTCDLLQELERSTIYADSGKWFETREITFTALAGSKMYRVTQLVAEFKSLLSSDNCTLLGGTRVYTC